MTKSKKHSPMQTETEPSIISQVPREPMKDFIEGLVALARSKQTQSSQEEMKAQLVEKSQQDPSLAALYGFENTSPDLQEKE